MTTKQEYKELMRTFDKVFMDMSIKEPELYLNPLFIQIKQSLYFEDFKNHCLEYFPKYPKRMSKWYCDTVIACEPSHEAKAKEVFIIINKYTSGDIAEAIASKTFPLINTDIIKEEIKKLTTNKTISSISQKFDKVLYYYLQKKDSTVVDLFSHYKKEDQSNLLIGGLNENSFKNEHLNELIPIIDNLPYKNELYLDFFNTKLDISNLQLFAHQFSSLLKDKLISGYEIENFIKTKEKYDFFIQNIVNSEDNLSKAFYYKMKNFDYNSTVNFLNNSLIKHYSKENILGANQFCVILSHLGSKINIKKEYKELTIYLIDILKLNSPELYPTIEAKVQYGIIHAFDNKNSEVRLDLTPIKNCLSEMLSQSLHNSLELKPNKKITKI